MTTMFQKRHYLLIARAIKDVRESGRAYTHAGDVGDDLDAYHGALSDLAENMADMLQQDNPLFKRDVFLAACGVT